MKAIVALVVIGLAASCSKKSDDPAPPPAPKPAISQAEVKRGQDACKAYVEKVCSCGETVPAAKERCTLDRALPESIDVAIQVSVAPNSERKDVVQSADSIRKTIAQCIEQTAKLPTLGCP